MVVEFGRAWLPNLRQIADFEISVATYPEGHPESVSATPISMFLESQDRLPERNRAITQFFVRKRNLFAFFLDKVQARGLDIPITPGIVPVQSFQQTAQFAKRAGASVPQWLARSIRRVDNDPQTRKLVAATVAAEQFSISSIRH